MGALRLLIRGCDRDRDNTLVAQNGQGRLSPKAVRALPFLARLIVGALLGVSTDLLPERFFFSEAMYV